MEKEDDKGSKRLTSVKITFLFSFYFHQTASRKYFVDLNSGFDWTPLLLPGRTQATQSVCGGETKFRGEDSD